MPTINSCVQNLRLNLNIEDALRSSVPKLTLDELFEKKDEIALEVQHQVAEENDYLRLYYRENLDNQG